MVHNDGDDELSSRQKKFIPINIITVALSLVAAITLLCMPFLTIDMGKMMDVVQEQLDEEQEESASNASIVYEGEGGVDGAEGDEGGASGEEEDGALDKDAVMDMMREAMDFKIALRPFDFVRAAQATNAFKELITSVLSMQTLTDMAMRLTANIAVTVILETEIGSEVSEEGINAVLDAVHKAEDGDIDGAKQEMSQAVQDIAADLGVEWTQSQQDKFDEYFDEMMEQGTDENGKFNMERMVVQLVSDKLGDENGETLQSYEDLIDTLFDKMSAEMGEVTDALSAGCWAIFAMLAFPAVMWGLLALLAFIHIFLKNKTFLTWYVKWTGFWPCLIFGVAPWLAGMIVGNKVAYVGAMLSAIGTTTWISGACFLALVFLSWFWLYPARRKIRRLRKEAQG